MNLKLSSIKSINNKEKKRIFVESNKMIINKNLRHIINQNQRSNNQNSRPQLLPKSIINYRGYSKLSKIKMVNANDIDNRNNTQNQLLNNKSPLSNKKTSKQSFIIKKNSESNRKDSSQIEKNISNNFHKKAESEGFNAQLKEENSHRITYNYQNQIDLTAKVDQNLEVYSRNQSKMLGIAQQSYMSQIQRNIFEGLDYKQKEEWKHYISKTRVLKIRNDSYDQFQEIQSYLLKVVMKYVCKHSQSKYSKFQQSCFGSDFSIIQNGKNGNNLRILKNINSQQCSCSESTTFFKDERKPSFANQSMNFNSSDFLSKIAQQNCEHSFKNSSMGFGKKQTKKKQSQTINALNLQIIVLEKKVQLLENNIKDLQDPTRKNQYQDEQDENNVSIQNLRILNQKKKYQNESQLRKIQYDALQRQYNSIIKINTDLKSQIEQTQQQIQQLKQKSTKFFDSLMYRELWLMLNQQFMALKDKYHQIVQQRNIILKKMNGLKQKNRQILKNFHMANEMVPNVQDDDKYQIQNIMRSFKQWLKVFSVPRVNNKMRQQKKDILNSGNQQDSNQPILRNNVSFKQKSEANSQTQDEMNYNLLRPNFFIFFQAYESSIISEKMFAHHRALEPNFYVKLRAMLDSFYNQFIICSHQQWVSFPEFVVGFIQKFTINLAKRIVQPRRKPIQTEQKVRFLIDLFNKHASNTIECQIFRNFILQQYYLDQIFFYLECRNQLNYGSVLTHKGFGVADPIVYVHFDHAISVIQSKLAKYDSSIIQKIKGIIVTRKKFKNGINLIDSNFVLKILLEVYAMEKTKSQKIFQQSFASKIRGLKISFGDFSAFITKNFKFLNSNEIAKLYRQTYMLSNGNITYKSIHYMCCVRGLFIPLLMNSKPSGACDARSLGEDMLFMDIQDQMCRLRSGVEQSGLEDLVQCQINLNQFLRDTQWQRVNKSVFFRNLLSAVTNIFRSKIYMEWSASFLDCNSPVSRDSVRAFMKEIKGYLKESQEAIGMLNKDKQRKNKAINMIIRNFKIRIAQTLEQFAIDAAQIPHISDNSQSKDLKKLKN